MNNIAYEKSDCKLEASQYIYIISKMGILKYISKINIEIWLIGTTGISKACP